ncbi:MAG TPA: alpha/beta fold hydrolase [Dehalococcoidia bacterium]|nr:alpha/beta fold hydrolase [Dehalococcoidia bacterium]
MEAPPVQYVKTIDGYDIAYTVTGEGPTLMFMPVRFSHVDSWNQSGLPLIAWGKGLSARFRLVRYDGRGQGLSTRGLSGDLTMDTLERDLETVVEHLKLTQFVLFGYGWSAHVAVNYAIRHPERLRMLVLLSCSVAGTAWPAAMHESLADDDWDLFLRSQTGIGQVLDVATTLQYMKLAITPADYGALMHAFSRSNLREVLPRVQTPTLVIQANESLLFRPEESIKVAAAIPRSRLVLTDGASSFADPSQGLKALDDFLAALSAEQGLLTAAPALSPRLDGLSAREIEVLRLVAAGRSNAQIADELVISASTVAKHVSSIFAKIGAANRVEAAGYARDRGLV